MRIPCDAEKLYPKIEELIKKLCDNERLTKREDETLRASLDEYWQIECPFEGKFCLPNQCPFATPQNWIEYEGYTSLADLLWYFEYEEIENLEVKEKRFIDPMDAHWARRCGHYNP